MKKFILIMLFTGSFTAAQTCGFSCFGLSGFYGGYSINEFNANNLNSYILNTLDAEKLIGEKPNFGRAEGYRIGANIFRAQFDSYFVSAKGFYQFLDQKQDFLQSMENLKQIDKYSLKLNYWGLGIDFGIPLFNFLDLKLFEGGITFYRAKLNYALFQNSQKMSEKNFETSKVDMSYYVGSGLIIHIIPNYISIEGTATYSIFTLDAFEDVNGNRFPPTLSSDQFLLSGKKFGATLQLNIGIPY